MKPLQSNPVIEERAIGAAEQLPMKPFKLVSDYVPAGDQPQAIKELIEGVNAHERDQVLLGVTGSGKTFTIAHVIQAVQRPALVLAPNKTLAAQLYGEMRSFFPENAVEYFVSYYDYYQPEAYVPRTDTYIEKESSLNEQIDRMRHSATRALFERRDVIIVASVSCIYGIGAPETYSTMTITLKPGDNIDFNGLVRRLIELQYKRNETAFFRGTFRIKGDILELFPAHLEDRAWRLSLFGEEIESIVEFDPLTGQKITELAEIKIYANSHYVTPKPTLQQAVKLIREELKVRLKELNDQGKLLEAQRLEQRVNFDMEMIEATGVCAGIENYSRYLTGRNPGEPPPTLFEYLPSDALLIADESHVSIPQALPPATARCRRTWSTWPPSVPPFTAAARSYSTIATSWAAPPTARSGRSPSAISKPCACWWPGANSGRIFAISAPTAFRRSRCLTTGRRNDLPRCG